MVHVSRRAHRYLLKINDIFLKATLFTFILQLKVESKGLVISDVLGSIVWRAEGPRHSI